MYYDFIFTADVAALSDSILGTAGIKLMKKTARDFAALDQAVTEAIRDASQGGSSGGASAGGGGGSSSGTKISYSYVTDGQSGSKEPVAMFSDLAGAQWAKEKIEALAQRGILSGMGDGTFGVLEPVTREQFVQMLTAAFGLTASADYENPFTDVMADAWYQPAVLAAADGLLADRMAEVKPHIHLSFL